MRRFFVIILLCLCLSPATAQAVSTIDVITDLSFGSFGIGNNNSVRTIIVTPAGAATYSARMIEGSVAPAAGEYLLEGLPPDTLLTITIDDTTLSRVGGGSPAFTIKDYTHNSPTTDPTGTATLLVGATLETSGSGAHYYSGNYTGTMNLTIFF